MKDNIEIFKAKFKEVMLRPVIPASVKFKEIRPEIEELDDCLAGPLYNLFEEGNIDYVYQGKLHLFENVKTLNDFSQWYLNIIYQYRKLINEVEVLSELEQIDKSNFIQHINDMEHLGHLVLLIIGPEQNHNKT